MKQYTKKECEDLLETAFKNLEEFKNETLNSLKATLDNLPDKYKKENSYKEYLHSKDLIQKTEEYFNGVFVQYTVDTYIFFNLMTKVPSIHNEFEEFYKLYFEENFHDIQP